jgi:hypothetical protein
MREDELTSSTRTNFQSGANFTDLSEVPFGKSSFMARVTAYLLFQSTCKRSANLTDSSDWYLHKHFPQICTKCRNVNVSWLPGKFFGFSRPNFHSGTDVPGFTLGWGFHFGEEF